jgi:hypothetical protein
MEKGGMTEEELMFTCKVGEEVKKAMKERDDAIAGLIQSQRETINMLKEWNKELRERIMAVDSMTRPRSHGSHRVDE